ncbi:molybdopterin-binding protein [Halanaerobium congolense]|jgi:molybdenum cofactor synthesis domain-containing protein|uniref:Molybdenum cofactor synthesis domain-containing protein n=1 Tax=Halanaerobium congolense TaxID=54121 RepID=A0A4R7DUX1_9FIRM|nr:molybdopterin-binding protein [Halanaerobium congolense]TDS24885.1 molybdenum cofactor synthesis domain-containing protein [Halanaerobium congolense]
MELNLLNKNELTINNVKLHNANLNDIAKTVSNVLKINREEVLVVDVRENHITLDILKRTISPEQIFGKQSEILDKLSLIDGVQLDEKTEINSQGILGNIALDEKETDQIISTSRKMAKQVQKNLAKKVKVFPTGFELSKNMIEDTNSPYIKRKLSKEGYNVKIGQILDDDINKISGQIRRTINEGYGLIVTTGGVGAEDKDKTIEGISKVAQEIYSPYIVHFEEGKGRHKKDGVRIAVAKIGQTLIVALPGPNDEVKMGLEVLSKELKESNIQLPKLAENIAKKLRKHLRGKMHELH